MNEETNISELKIHVLYIREAVERMEREDAVLRRLLDKHEAEDNRRFESMNAKLNRIIGGIVLAGALAGFASRVFGG